MENEDRPYDGLRGGYINHALSPAQDKIIEARKSHNHDLHTRTSLSLEYLHTRSVKQK